MDYLKEFSDAIRQSNQELFELKQTVLQRVDALEKVDMLSPGEVSAVRALIAMRCGKKVRRDGRTHHSVNPIALPVTRTGGNC